MPLDDARISVIDIARTTHEACRALQLSLGQYEVEEPWLDLDEHGQLVTVSHVQKVLEGSTPEGAHEHLNKELLKDGTPAHALMPYAELPMSTRLKDALFVGIVQAMAFGLDHDEQLELPFPKENLA
jgi:hypothetical protein